MRAKNDPDFYRVFVRVKYIDKPVDNWRRLHNYQRIKKPTHRPRASYDHLTLLKKSQFLSAEADLIDRIIHAAREILKQTDFQGETEGKPSNSASNRHIRQRIKQHEKVNPLIIRGFMRSVAYGFRQFSSLHFNINHLSYKELQTFSIKVKVSKPNQKYMLYANCTPI